jgi:protein phosphatase
MTATTAIRITEPSLIVLIGPSGSGKSTFANRHFLNHEIVSSDACRAVISNDPLNQAVTHDAFELFHTIISKRLKWGKLCVADATNVSTTARAQLIGIARAHSCPTFAIVFNLEISELTTRLAARSGVRIQSRIIKTQLWRFAYAIEAIHTEGFDRILVFESVADIEKVVFLRHPSTL